MAKATAMLEDAIEVAVAQQSPHAASDALLEGGRRLHAAVLDVATFAQAAAIITTAGSEGQPANREHCS